VATDLQPVYDYIHTLEQELAAGNATEHTHRPALKSLLESLASGVKATNEPRRIECGAPDFVISKNAATIGYIEAKDTGESLDKVEKSEQLKRYRDSLTNLILTDYLEFRWYVNGDLRLSARLGTMNVDSKLKQDKSAIQAVVELLADFLAHKAESVGTPKELAQRMARLAHLVRNLIIAAFDKEPESGTLHTQLSAFRSNLIPDLEAGQFADMYAQTIAYGLFAARCAAPDNKDFTRQNAAYLLPKTNPFLRKLFNHIAGPELDDRIAWLVDDLAQLLAQADMEAILKDFGKHMGKEDPVVHFYETFLKEYDPKVREMRGVYYTPEPVVSYIVRSIDRLLKDRFNKPQGLADDKTLILDPAVGTATFLYMVINEIHKANISQGQQGTWNNYVTDKLLPRIFGFELLMAPYAVAHLKLGLLLQETGYEFKSDQRLGIYLTNTLEEVFKKSEQLAGFNEYIVDEANAAAEIKKEKPIMVVLGNPPYSGASANKGEWAKQLIETYKTVDGQPLGEKNPKWLQDDYVKFIRFGQWRIERTGQGILGFITNHGYLDNPTFRGMRQSLMNTFTDIYILNLHGNAKKKEVAPDGGKDENIFDIQQGVAIGIFVKEPDKNGPAKVHYTDSWGLREGKYLALLESDISVSDWKELKPSSPFYLFVLRDESRLEEYDQCWVVTKIFRVFASTVTTARNDFSMAYTPNTLTTRIDDLTDELNDDQSLREKYQLKDVSYWNLKVSRENLRQITNIGSYIKPYCYRPFDFRFIYYHSAVCERLRSEVMHHMEKDNIALLTHRPQSPKDFTHAYCTNMIGDQCVAANKTEGGGNSYQFPLYLYPVEKKTQLDKSGGKESGIQAIMQTQTKREPNFNPEFTKIVSEKLGLEFVEDGRGDLTQTLGPEDIFNYAYAILHSPTYRTRYAEFLKIDFPRLPLTSDKKLFNALAETGAELVALHLMESPTLNNIITKYPVSGSNKVEKVNYGEKSQCVYINKEQYFEGVPPEVWNFHVGGYQVCQKWLKDRKGRLLNYDDLTHYQRIVVAIKETIRLMAEIDVLIPRWPLD
jgi:predicted helicase